MPVFHTKTIQQVLEPVAIQVSNLVILHEKGEDGAAMPPLEQPIAVVKEAVINLAQVGNQQIQTTTDEVMKIDAPKSIQKVTVASDMLVDASKILALDNHSKEGREKLITGARGILQGTSDLLLVFDAKEVRSICHLCQSVRDYLKVSEVIATIEDLITFVKNLTPGIANMTKHVLNRSENLTNVSHAQKLTAKVNSIKSSLPNLITSLKAFVTTVKSEKVACDASNENSQFYITNLSEDITEIIHVLQLVSTDVESVLEKVDAVDPHEIYNNLVENIRPLMQCLNDNSVVNNDAVFYKAVSDIRCIADNAEDTKREAIYKKTDNLVKAFEMYKELQKTGNDKSPEIIAQQQQLQQCLDDVMHDVNNAIKQIDLVNSARNVIASKTPIVKEWLIDPTAKPTHVSGCEVTKDITNAAKIIVQQLLPQKKVDNLPVASKIQHLCDEIDDSMQNVVKYREIEHGALPEAREASKDCLNKIMTLNNHLSEIITKNIQPSSVNSKIESINSWLSDPEVNDNGEGILAGENIISLARSLAGNIKNAELQNQLLQKAMECGHMSAQLNELQRCGQGGSSEAYEFARKLKTKFSELKEITEDALVEAVADDFSNTSATLKQFNEAAVADKTVLNREEKFNESALALKLQAIKIASLGKQAVSMSKYGNAEKLEAVNAVANKILQLNPQVVNAGKVVFASPENLQGKENLISICNEWSEKVDDLTSQVDNAVDVLKFVQASEEAVRREKEICSAALLADDQDIVLSYAGKIARRANRILMAGKQEVENIDDKNYVDGISKCMTDVDVTINPMVLATREYAQNPSLQSAKDNLESKNNELVCAVSQIRTTVEARYIQEKMQALKVEEKPPCPPLPIDEEAPSRPPLPEEEEEDEFPEDYDTDEPQMMQAARELHEETTKWHAKGNNVISAAKRMALLMARMSQLVGSEDGKKSDLIACAKDIAKASGEVTALTLEIAEKCTDKRIRNDLKKTLDRIPTVSTQLRILSTVKAASLGDKEVMTKEEEDAADQATEMLVHNAQNLMASVKEAVRCAEAASIRIRSDTAGTVKWVRK